MNSQKDFEKNKSGEFTLTNFKTYNKISRQAGIGIWINTD